MCTTGSRLPAASRGASHRTRGTGHGTCSCSTRGTAMQAQDGTQDRTAMITVATLTAMVVGSMVGAGVFSLPSRFAGETGVLGALISWLVAGTGMLMLAFVFQRLAIRKPDLDSGVYAYAKAGFGEYLGFFSAFGYWASACVGNVTYWILIMSTLGAVLPVLGDGDQPRRHRRQGAAHRRVRAPRGLPARPAGARRELPGLRDHRPALRAGPRHHAGDRLRLPRRRGRERLLAARAAPCSSAPG